MRFLVTACFRDQFSPAGSELKKADRITLQKEMSGQDAPDEGVSYG